MEKEKNVSTYNQSVSDDSALSRRDRKKARKRRIKESKRQTGFYAFRTKDAIIRAIKAILVGIAVALLVGGIYTIITKVIPLTLYPLHPLVIALVFISMFLVLGIVMAIAFVPAFAISFFGLRRGDKSFAKTIDEQFYLKESMQTMLEHAGDNSEMASLQREGVKEKVNGLRHRMLKPKKLYIYIISVLLSALFIWITFCIPYRIIKEEPVTATFKLTDMQEKKLKQIEASVRSSDMKSPAKEEVAEEIAALTNALKVTTDFDTAKSLVELSVGNGSLEGHIDMLTKKAGTAYVLHDILVEDDTAFVREIGRLLTKLDSERFEEKREIIRQSFVHKDFSKQDEEGVEIEIDMEKVTSDTVKLLRDNASELKRALELSGIDSADSLYMALLKVTIDMEALASELEDGSINYHNAVGRDEGKGELINVISNGIYFALDKQNISYSVGFGASDEIREMFPEFELKAPQREDNKNEKKENDKEDEENDEEKDTDGGAGDGDVFGSNDLIYDKEHGQIKYGEVIDKYHQIMNSSSYTEEQKKIMQEYFDILYRGLEDEKGE